jgi:DNA-binding NarL/FixJ family response regulator
MANEARLESLRTPLRRASPSAKVTYSDAVQSLKSQLAIAEKNAPLERQAQVVANTMVAQRKRANPTMDKDTERKISGQALTTARIRTGAGKTRIDITPREWEAIQAGAISNHMLEKILRNTDVDKVRKLATPRVNPVMTPALTSRARTMLASGYTAAEVADHLGVAVSTLKSSVAEGG